MSPTLLSPSGGFVCSNDTLSIDAESHIEFQLPADQAKLPLFTVQSQISCQNLPTDSAEEPFFKHVLGYANNSGWVTVLALFAALRSIVK